MKGREVKRRVAPRAIGKLKHRIRRITRRSGGRSIGQVAQELRRFLLGWREYFKLADTPGVFRALDAWIRRRLRMLQLKHWKRGPAALRAMLARGVPLDVARKVTPNVSRWWHTSKHLGLSMAMPDKYFDALGVPRLAA